MTERDLLDRVLTDRRDLLNMDRLNADMAEKGLDGVVALSQSNVTYTGGVLMPTSLMELWTFVATTAEGNQGVVVNEAEGYLFREYSWIEDVRSFRFASSRVESNQQAIALLADMLQDMGLGEGRLGIEKTYLPVVYWEELVERVPRAEFVDASNVFEYARLVKTPTEIELFRLAAYYTDKAIQTAFALAKPGDTEKAIASQMQAIVLRLGASELGYAHIHSGAHANVIHAWPMGKPLEPGEVVHVDFGGIFGGYCTDVSRNAIVNRADPDQEAIYRRLWEIEQLVFEHIRPGTVAGELFDIAQRAFEEAGLLYPWGTFGHSLGLRVHEGFHISHGSDVVLEPGMVIAIEPTHVEQGKARYHLEDNLLITEDGVELLSNFMDTERLFVIR